MAPRRPQPRAADLSHHGDRAAFGPSRPAADRLVDGVVPVVTGDPLVLGVDPSAPRGSWRRSRRLASPFHRLLKRRATARSAVIEWSLVSRRNSPPASTAPSWWGIADQHQLSLGSVDHAAKLG
jgi:hypothetical protein